MKRVLLFGGTFDPVHRGHMAIFTAALASLSPDEAVLVPAGNPWQKGHSPRAAADDRVAMLALAFPGTTIDQRELQRPGPTYTVETLAEFHHEVPGRELIWLVGSDSFAGLDTWHDAGRLSKLATFAVVRRPGSKPTFPRGAFHHHDVPCEAPDISSTAIRAACAAGGDISRMVAPAVCDYIRTHRLYREER